MVAPKNPLGAVKKNVEGQREFSSSPEPFREPDGMTTIDLNKSDDYSEEMDIKRDKLKQKAQIQYVTRLLFALGSIMFIVFAFITVAFLNKDYRLFTLKPLQVNQSYPTTASPTEEFVNLTKILNQALFRDKLKSGRYLHDSYGNLDECKLTQTIESCCEVFSNTDLDEFVEFCTVNDMLDILLEFEMNHRNKRQVSDYPFYDNMHEDGVFREAEYYDEFNEPVQYFENPNTNFEREWESPNLQNFEDLERHTFDELNLIHHPNTWDFQREVPSDDQNFESADDVQRNANEPFDISNFVQQDPRVQDDYAREQSLDHLALEKQKSLRFQDSHEYERGWPRYKEYSSMENGYRFLPEFDRSVHRSEPQTELGNLDETSATPKNDEVQHHSVGSLQKKPLVAKYGTSIQDESIIHSEATGDNSGVNINPNVKVNRKKDDLEVATMGMDDDRGLAMNNSDNANIKNVKTVERKVGNPQKKPLVSKFGESVKIIHNITTNQSTPTEFPLNRSGINIPPNMKVNKDKNDNQNVRDKVKNDDETSEMVSEGQRNPLVSKFGESVKLRVNGTGESSEGTLMVNIKDKASGESHLHKKPLVSKFGESVKLRENESIEVTTIVNVKDEDGSNAEIADEAHKKPLVSKFRESVKFRGHDSIEVTTTINVKEEAIGDAKIVDEAHKKPVVSKFGESVKLRENNTNEIIESTTIMNIKEEALGDRVLNSEAVGEAYKIPLVSKFGEPVKLRDNGTNELVEDGMIVNAKDESSGASHFNSEKKPLVSKFGESVKLRGNDSIAFVENTTMVNAKDEALEKPHFNLEVDGEAHKTPLVSKFGGSVKLFENSTSKSVEGSTIINIKDEALGNTDLNSEVVGETHKKPLVSKFRESVEEPIEVTTAVNLNGDIVKDKKLNSDVVDEAHQKPLVSKYGKAVTIRGNNTTINSTREVVSSKTPSKINESLPLGNIFPNMEINNEDDLEKSSTSKERKYDNSSSRTIGDVQEKGLVRKLGENAKIREEVTSKSTELVKSEIPLQPYDDIISSDVKMNEGKKNLENITMDGTNPKSISANVGKTTEELVDKNIEPNYSKLPQQDDRNLKNHQETSTDMNMRAVVGDAQKKLLGECVQMRGNTSINSEGNGSLSDLISPPDFKVIETKANLQVPSEASVDGNAQKETLLTKSIENERNMTKKIVMENKNESSEIIIPYYPNTNTYSTSLNKSDMKNVDSVEASHKEPLVTKFGESVDIGDKLDNKDNLEVSVGVTEEEERFDSVERLNENKTQSRANPGQDDFRAKPKQLDAFSANEDVHSNQQTQINPCYYPYMNPYMPVMPAPSKLGSPQDSQYLKIVQVSQPKVQQQPMYVLNPAMYYNIPQTPYVPTGYFPAPPATFQNPVSQSRPIQVSSSAGQYYMCNPIPTPTNNIAGIAGVEIRREALNLQSLVDEEAEFGNNNRSREASSLICPLGEQACLDGTKCIKNHHICDSEVNCDDSSDEVACSCKERVGKLRLCDGYCDCPRCEDERGCFGCDENEFSCDDWSRFRRSTCIPLVQRCDGIKQCEITGKDEMDCSILADHIGNFPLNKISNSVGFLHRNFKGKWYPTCFGTELWAAEVCQVEAGPSAIIPKAHMTLTTDPYTGLFINILPNNEIRLVNTCVQDRAAFVECPPIYCGLRFLVNNPYRSQEIDTSVEDMLNDLERAYKQRESEIQRHAGDLGHLEVVVDNSTKKMKRRDTDDGAANLKQSRVVGGKPSQPAAWPWLVSIYKNGIFHCGGVLINELWVLTASHCVDRYWQYYYEIQAGALRRFSYSPMDQRRWAKVVVPHEFYSKTNLRNDIALMKLSAPVRYNRYVRPICLPSETTAGQDFLKGPSPGTICTTVGWGATIEHGADPDHMREVEVPILQHCRHKEDSDVEEICAGLSEGGKDACQGDSGGPLMCRNPNNPNQWYLAGIVSHGEGCARPNEPGVYTKVSRYMGWIAENTRDDKYTLTVPLRKCPGYVCKGTKRCIAKKRKCDRIVDCLLGDDELNCEHRFQEIFKHSRKSFTSMANTPGPSDDIVTELMEHFMPLGNLDLVGSTHDVNNNDDNIEEHLAARLPDGRNSSRFEDLYFKCTTLLQIVPREKRCDKILDCEDGSDETLCSCADYVKAVDPTAICDGVTDCLDSSDEARCIQCKQTDYTCRLSQTCIDLSKKCDGNADCPQGEDETDCVSLTNGHNITLDEDQKPIFGSRGIVTINNQGLWKPLCLNTSSTVNEEPALSTTICNLLGFDEFLTFHEYRIEQRKLNLTTANSGRIVLDTKGEKCENCCDGLYVSCSNTSTASTLHHKSLESAKELYFSPWAAAIYSDGKFKCVGTLLDESWIVTSVNCFMGIITSTNSYVTAVLGKGKLNLPVKGPHEQIIQVSRSIRVNETDIVLLRLEREVKFNRYVQAADLNARRDGMQKEKCYAVGTDNENKTKFVALTPLKRCLVGFRCFEKKIEENCKDNHPWSGTIICDSRVGWYPAAVFNEKDGHCGFSHQKKYTSVKFYKTLIYSLMGLTGKPVQSPTCHGFRCDLGNCISSDKVCNGVQDCSNGEDEKDTHCYEKEIKCHLNDQCTCPSTHLKCPSTNKCLPKATFCDRTNDCGEYEDEPNVCSCRNYLTLTNPSKICDGIVNCLDRSDEDPEICSCKIGDFQCGRLNRCVSHEMVCDGTKDCPQGEDEAYCLSMKSENSQKNAGEVLTRTAGVWHMGCFELSYPQNELDDICTKLGFKGSNASQLPPPRNLTTLAASRPILDPFEVVWLRRQPNNKMRLRLRSGNEPYVKFVPDETCHRLFIACI